MGLTHVTVALKGFDASNGTYEADFLVDTGANFTVLPAKSVKKLGIKPIKKQQFSLADGTIVERSLGHTMVEINGDKSPTTVILGEKDDAPLIGVITLEEMGLMVHPFERMLVPMKLMLG